MSDDAIALVRSLQTDRQLAHFASRLQAWLLTDAEAPSAGAQRFPESRAQALLRSADVVDDATISDFRRQTSTGAGARIALYDLLAQTGLGELEQVRSLAAVLARSAIDENLEVPWLSLALASHALQRGYPLAQLDPASPPQRYSPAGQVVKQTATYLRQQVQRSPTERDRLAQALAPREGASSESLGELRADGVIPPLPPHFRPPIPVRYPEFSHETLQVEPLEDADSQAVSRGDSLVITEDDLPDDASAGEEQASEPGEPMRMPPIRIAPEQVREAQLPSPMPPGAVVMPAGSSDARPGLTVALRQMFGSEELSTTKLRVITQEYPDGPGLFGLQVKISCKGIKSFVAGTTDRDGRFLAELPVKQTEGLTYDVDVTWPRELGGETERKSLTLHADRTEFLLPFYLKLEPQRHQDD